MKNTIEFEVTSNLALFTNPHVSTNNNKVTYPVPTYGALVGVCESIYWNPTLLWVIDEARIMEQIRTRSISYCSSNRNGGQNMRTNIYIMEPRYQVRAHFEWDLRRPDLKQDRVSGKHYSMAKRYLSKGGKRPIYLGKNDDVAFAEECVFGEGEGYYDKSGTLPFGIMYHSMEYIGKGRSEETCYPLWWQPVMENGVIKYIRPEQCTLKVA